MPRHKRFWSWVVFILGVVAFVPIAIGGWHHPQEINIASYGLWLIISGMLTYSSYARRFPGWWMPFGFFVGNAAVLILGFIRGGYTFDLSPTETFPLYGSIGAIALWVIVGTVTKKWSSRILFLGGVFAVMLSFYPQMKQYLLPHDPPTWLMMVGWYLWILSSFVNVVVVERFFKKLMMTKTAYEQLYGKTKNIWLIVEESLFSLENLVFMIVTVIMMAR